MLTVSDTLRAVQDAVEQYVVPALMNSKAWSGYVSSLLYLAVQ